MANWARNTPMRLKWVGSKNARSEALILGYWLT